MASSSAPIRIASETPTTTVAAMPNAAIINATTGGIGAGRGIVIATGIGATTVIATRVTVTATAAVTGGMIVAIDVLDVYVVGDLFVVPLL